MVGPSSSHTAGAARIGQAARNLLHGQPQWAKIHLYESFAKTYKGHGTDFALVGGLLGFATDDSRLKKALKIAKDRGLDVTFIDNTAAVDHQNTVRLRIGDAEDQVELFGFSIGVAKIDITVLNGFQLCLYGNHPALFIMHNEHFIANTSVTSILAKHK